ncbi:MAG TPA: protoheme IX farnesyltransferase [Nitrospinae bacterium]|nr:protoheme IX farnesyltransferase [Nitrospinota bacterium]
MITRSEPIEMAHAAFLRRLGDFISLTKPRIVLMALVAVAAAFYLATQGRMDYLALFHALLGTSLATGGALALNQVAEEDIDFKMKRTRLRPLPDRRLHTTEALAFGVGLLVVGVFYLIFLVNPLAAFFTALSGVMYLIFYTPLKRISSWNSVVGAIPGAMPPVIGWAAAAGEISVGGWILFSILFIWQIPHALAIGILYRDDFKAAGVRLLPVDEPDGRKTGFHVINYCATLIPIALIPTLIGMAGLVYFFSSLILGLAYLGTGIYLAKERSIPAARLLFYVSLVYLPLILVIMVLDHGGI